MNVDLEQELAAIASTDVLKMAMETVDANEQRLDQPEDVLKLIREHEAAREFLEISARRVELDRDHKASLIAHKKKQLRKKYEELDAALDRQSVAVFSAAKASLDSAQRSIDMHQASIAILQRPPRARLRPVATVNPTATHNA